MGPLLPIIDLPNVGMGWPESGAGWPESGAWWPESGAWWPESGAGWPESGAGWPESGADAAPGWPGRPRLPSCRHARILADHSPRTRRAAGRARGSAWRGLQACAVLSAHKHCKMIATQAADERTQANGPVVLGHYVIPMPFHK